jgi:ribonuclease I
LPRKGTRIFTTEAAENAEEKGTQKKFNHGFTWRGLWPQPKIYESHRVHREHREFKLFSDTD